MAFISYIVFTLNVTKLLKYFLNIYVFFIKINNICILIQLIYKGSSISTVNKDLCTICNKIIYVLMKFIF